MQPSFTLFAPYAEISLHTLSESRKKNRSFYWEKKMFTNPDAEDVLMKG
jgi:hypothetical protein